jgi:glycosyltransferase involved in cell wall biosynthesis
MATLSVIIPALNEEGNLEAAVRSVLAAIGTRFEEYELLVFDDGSTDRTGEIADRLAKENDRIRVIHNGTNKGFGYNYTRGVQLARMEYVTLFPGDNEIPLEAIRTILLAVGAADIVIPYISTPEVRPWSRRVVSIGFVVLLNVLFGLRLRYYNGPCIHRRVRLQAVPMRTHGFAYMASILVRLIRSGCTYVEVPMPLQARQHGRTKAFRLKNIISVLGTLAELFWEVRIAHRDRYAVSPQRVEMHV